MLVEQTHEVRHEWRNNERPMRWTDTRLDEQQRAVSLKMVPMSLLLESSTGKSFLMNLIDSPGESRTMRLHVQQGFLAADLVLGTPEWECLMISFRCGTTQQL